MGNFSDTFRDFRRKDLRWSYGAVGILIIIGVLSNIFFRHGWAIWPFCFAAGAMAMVHEAAERTGQGVPPLYVYTGVVVVLVIWAILATIASFLHPIVLFIGFAVLAYQLLRGFIQQRERKRLIEYRREEDLCVRCGEPIDHTRATCFACGQEPDPAQLKRIASVVKNRDDYTRSRSVLTPQRATATVAQKEQALLQRRRERRQH
ncbi:MAG TPA: hypothetical protein VGP99_01740 [Tepidisphaeraceae bacterium]|jgi:hypothetical protein|nr:hypothetical protein [Tepidisphaeraceae bacterium]